MKPSILLTACLLLSAGTALHAADDPHQSVPFNPPKLPVGDCFTPLPGKSVQFHGYLEDYVQNNLLHYSKEKAPYADFVQFFRKGRPQFALGELWGKAVRAGAMYYRATQDPELKTILQKTVADLLTTKRANGSISCSAIPQQPDGNGGDLWERKYVLLGLDEYYRQVEKAPLVMQAMIDQADCILMQIGPPPKVGITEQGWSPNKIESSTLLEPILRLYKITGYPRYREFADYIIKSGGAAHCDLVDDAWRNVEPAKMGFPYAKCYEMLSYFEGVCEYYRVTGDARYKQAVFNMFRNVLQKEITISGGGGGPAVSGEAWDNTALKQTDPKAPRMMETCTGVTLSKLASQICFLSGDPATIDYIEQYAYNGLIGAMKPSGDFFSYCNRLNGAKIDPNGWGWTFHNFRVTCCSANAACALAYLPYVAVMNSQSGPVINLYNAATVQVATPTAQLAQLEISGDYPFSGAISVAVTLPRPERFTMRLRIPAWSQQTILSVQGQSLPVTPGTYVEISREWTSGDRIQMTLDMRCRLLSPPQGGARTGNQFRAIVRGPLVLARDENIDPAFADPVTIVDHDGYVAAIPTVRAKPTRHLQCQVPTTTGFIQMVDFASVDNWNGRHICTWMPTGNSPDGNKR